MSSTPGSIAIPQTSLWANRKCLLVACIVATANMQYGFDSAAVGALQAMPGFLKVFGYVDPSSPLGYGIDSTVQQLITSLLTLGAFISSLVAGIFGAFLGRKPALWGACLLNFVALAIQIATTNKGVLYFGRLLLGFSNGFLVTFSNVYTSEIAPAHLRGLMVALFAYWVNIGAIWGTIVDNYTAPLLSKGSYRIPIACLYIVPTMLGIGLFFVPESPRWLLHRNREQEARKSLETLRADSVAPEYLELEWAEMIRGMEEEKRIAKSVGIKDMFRGADLRRTLLCYGVIGTQAGSGSWFIIAYTTYFFTIAGIDKPFQYSIMNTCIGFIGVNCGMFAIRHLVGRRFILVFGSIACGLCYLGMAVADSVHSTSNKSVGNALLAFVALFQFFYNGCVGAASYPVATELVSSRLRAWTVGSATSIGYVLAWLVSFCTPYFINPTDLNWGPKYGYIWAASNFICALFFYFFIPEMKGRTLEELDELFENHVSVKKFKKYHTMIQEEAVHDVQVNIGAFLEKESAIIQVENRVENIHSI